MRWKYDKVCIESWWIWSGVTVQCGLVRELVMLLVFDNFPSRASPYSVYSYYVGKYIVVDHCKKRLYPITAYMVRFPLPLLTRSVPSLVICEYKSYSLKWGSLVIDQLPMGFCLVSDFLCPRKRIVLLDENYTRRRLHDAYGNHTGYSERIYELTPGRTCALSAGCTATWKKLGHECIF